MKQKSNHFSGQIGFVLAAAGSAVGVGNLWRFPYLAAKDGGGLFLIVYLALVLTFGFALLTSDIAIGRKTQKSAIGAYAEMHPKWKFLGLLTFLVPVLIMTYYAVIGGRITKYAVVYFTGQANAAAQDNYFTSFITSPVSPVIFALLFMAVTAFVVYNGVEDGIEKVSRFMMPVLLVLVVVIAVYSLTLKNTGADGVTRTGLQGFLYYVTPHLEGLTVSRFLQILLDAMGTAGTFVGALFFITAFFATLTSCISVLESITANCVDIFHTDRKKTVLVLSVIYLAASAAIALGYSKLYFELPLPNGSVGQLLDLMDYISNSVMMPFIALLSTILIGWIKKPQYVIGKMERNGETFRRKGVYTVMICYIAPVMMFILFLQSTGILS